MAYTLSRLVTELRRVMYMAAHHVVGEVAHWVVSLTLIFLFITFGFGCQTNASSGMGVADHSKSTYLELQRKKVHRYVIFKIDEKKKEVVVEKTGGPAESYEDFTASLPENDCRYAVYDFDFVTSENCQKSKIFFIAWYVFLSTYLTN